MSQKNKSAIFIAKILVVVSLVVAVSLVVYAKRGASQEKPAIKTPVAVKSDSPPNMGAVPQKTAQIPKLVDLGAGKCIPCKMMAPILEEMKKEYAGKLDVVFIDVWENKNAGEQYGIELIPTQIFFDASGKELFRHEGFFSKEDILAKWKQLGVDLPLSEMRAK